MSRHKIYRVEHEVSGIGPFGGPLRDALSDYCQRLPALYHEVEKDCPGFVIGYHFCAVERLDQIEKWFGPFRAELLTAGFALYEYEPLPRNVLPSQSGTQVAFAKYPATPRRRLNW